MTRRAGARTRRLPGRHGAPRLLGADETAEVATSAPRKSPAQTRGRAAVRGGGCAGRRASLSVRYVVEEPVGGQDRHFLSCTGRLKPTAGARHDPELRCTAEPLQCLPVQLLHTMVA